MKKILKRARLGITSLETAVVIPVLLAVTLGAVDVARVIQAHQTLRDAAKVANRCIYPTDAACVAAAPSLSVTNMFQYELVSNTRETPRMDYSGTASWLSAPEMLFNNFQARVLSDVRFDGQFATNSYVIQSVPPPPSYAAIGSGSYLEMQHVGVPWVRFANDATLTPTFYTDAGQSSSLTPVVDVTPNLHLTSNMTGPWQTIWSSDGQPGAWRPYRLSQIVDANNVFTCVKGDSMAGFGNRRSCAEPGLASPSSNPQSSRIAFDIRGSGSGGNANFTVRVYMWNPNSTETRIQNLNGRKYDGPTNLALLPRGFPADRIINSQVLTNHGYLDDVANNGFIEVPWGWHFEVQGDVDGVNAHMDIERLRIFAPSFALRQVSGSCGCGGSQLSATSPGTALQPTQCPTIFTDCASNTIAPGVLGSGVQPILYSGANSMASSVTSSTVGYQPPPQYTLPVIGGANGCFASFEEAQARRNQTITSAGLSNVAFQANVNLAPSQSSCSGVNVQQQGVIAACATNFGVAETANPQTGRITNSASAASQCPPSASNLISATNVSWGETVANIDHAPVSFTPSTCAALTPDWSADAVLAQYPKFIAPAGSVAARHPVLTEHANPQVLKDSVQFSCGQFEVESREFDDSEEFAQSLFNGTHSNLGCNWEAVLRNEAEFGPNVPAASRLKGYEFFVAASAEKGWDYQKTSDLTCAACSSCRFSTSRVTVPGLFVAGSSPAACSGLPGGTWCESRAYAVTTAGQNGGVTVNETEAARIAFDELKATIPSAKRDCSGSDCTEVTVVADTAAGTVNASVTYNMPLYVLGNRSITLSSAISEKFETKFSN